MFLHLSRSVIADKPQWLPQQLSAAGPSCTAHSERDHWHRLGFRNVFPASRWLSVTFPCNYLSYRKLCLALTYPFGLKFRYFTAPPHWKKHWTKCTKCKCINDRWGEERTDERREGELQSTQCLCGSINIALWPWSPEKLLADIKEEMERKTQHPAQNPSRGRESAVKVKSKWRVFLKTFRTNKDGSWFWEMQTKPPHVLIQHLLNFLWAVCGCWCWLIPVAPVAVACGVPQGLILGYYQLYSTASSFCGRPLTKCSLSFTVNKLQGVFVALVETKHHIPEQKRN